MNGMSPSEAYSNTVDELADRIVALGPGILEVDDPWVLFTMGLECTDIGPTLFQAGMALRLAQQRLRA